MATERPASRQPSKTINSVVSVVPNTTVDISLVHRLTNLNDINRLLHETVAKERVIDTELEKLLARRSDLERNILVLNASTSEMLELVRADAEALQGSVQGTAGLASKISSKVRKLDLAQSRVQEVVNRITLILDRTNCINDVQTALDNDDYEAAAQCIETFTELEAQLKNLPQLTDSKQVEEQRQVLLEAKAKLQAIADHKMEEATVQRDQVAVQRFTRIYKPLGLKAEGISKVSEYLRLVVAGQAAADYDSMSELLDAGKKVDFVAAVTRLFQSLALSLDSMEGVLRETYGPECILEIVTALQAECDVQGVRLIQRYLEARGPQRLVREITHKRTDSKGHGPEQSVDPRVVEGHVAELVQLCQRSEEYTNFMLSRMQQAVAPAQLSTVRETSFRSGQFNVTVRELVGYYVALEEFYMDATCRMAISIDETVPGGLTSSMVDDVFFILKKCGMRALAIANVQCASALLAELNNLLANDLRAALLVRLQGGPARLLAIAPSAAGDSSGALPNSAAASGGVDHAVALNNLDVSADYVSKLRQEMEGFLMELFPSASEREKVRNVVSDLGRTSGELRQLHTRGLEQLSDAMLPKFRAVLDEVALARYQLSENEYASNESEDTWVQRLLAAFEQHLQWLSSLLTPNSFEGLFHLMLDKIVARLEAILSKKTFNQLGGLQMDRDARLLVTHLSELTTRTVRDKFARLNQMAIVLSLETVEELLDYWNDDAAHITWRLTPGEVRTVLSQRVDFSQDSILALAL